MVMVKILMEIDPLSMGDDNGFDFSLLEGSFPHKTALPER